MKKSVTVLCDGLLLILNWLRGPVDAKNVTHTITLPPADWTVDKTGWIWEVMLFYKSWPYRYSRNASDQVKNFQASTIQFGEPVLTATSDSCSLVKPNVICCSPSVSKSKVFKMLFCSSWLKRVVIWVTVAFLSAHKSNHSPCTSIIKTFVS